ncbi:MAG TPA: chemotaxis protein CheW [Terriglobia bacterium]|nr:chemotaxis protein CheW [Terriglobia bacterium]
MDVQDDIVKEFLVESNENLDQVDRDLISLEKEPSSREILARIFRAIHTIKGTTGFLGFAKLESVAHAGENLLSRLRDGTLALTSEITSALLALVDAVREMLLSIEATGQDGDGDYSSLTATLSRLLEAESKSGTSSPQTLASKPTPVPSAPPQTKAQPPCASPSAVTSEAESTCPPQPKSKAEPVSASTSAPLGSFFCNTGHVTEQQVASALEQQMDGDPRHVGEILVEQGLVQPGEVLEALQAQKEARASVLSSGNIRVDVGQLDKLMNLVGELVLARNQILQYSARQQDPAFLGTSQRLNLITTELQEGVMKTRMQPIDNVWNRFPRVVRDLAMSCGKRVRVEMEGKETELDKTIIEAIKDPLTHIVRNSVDHGIETPEKRIAAGKPAEGRLFLRAFHEGGQVNIEVSDDGAGVDLDRVKRKAVERGLITSEQAGRMSEREALNLLFLPGFSTAAKVTNVSGRGVGMDVVKTNIEKIGGFVDIQNKPGQGATLKIKIPLTLAIIPALVVTGAGDRYAIPQISLLELVRLEGEGVRQGIESIHGAPVYRLRGNLLPLVYLNRELGFDDGSADARGSDLRTLDFEAAIKGHEAWKVRLREFLDGKGSFDEEEVGRNDRCLLGKWLYSPKVQQYRYLTILKQLEKAHTEFHQQAKRVIVVKRSNNADQAERDLASLATMSGDVVSLISALRKTVSENAAVNIVVLQADDRQFGLVVDEVNDTEEIVVKPLGKRLKGLSTFAGATIMGDGKVALILDVMGLAHRASVISELRERGLLEDNKAEAADDRLEEQQTLLLFQSPDDGRMAVPLSLVTRLEEFPCSEIEKTGTQEVVQYRGSILPLIRISALLTERRRKARRAPGRPASQDGKVQVVVYSDQERSIGLIVDRILDIVEENLSLQQTSARGGIRGSAVIQGRVTEILDLESLVRTYATPPPNKSAKRKRGSENA